MRAVPSSAFISCEPSLISLDESSINFLEKSIYKDGGQKTWHLWVWLNGHRNGFIQSSIEALLPFFPFSNNHIFKANSAKRITKIFDLVESSDSTIILIKGSVLMVLLKPYLFLLGSIQH